MFLIEVAWVARFQIDHANNSVLGDERHSQFRAHVGYGGDILGILRDIIDQDRLPRLCGLSGHSFAEL